MLVALLALLALVTPVAAQQAPGKPPAPAASQSAGAQSPAAAQPAGAQPTAEAPPTSDATQATLKEAALDSPRAALVQYLELARAGRYEEAGAYLELSPERAARPGEAARAARRLKAVLDRHVWFDLEQVSPDAEGDLTDDLAPNSDELGRIPGTSGVPEPVRFTRQEAGTQPAWRFSLATVGQVDSWFARLPDRWVLEHLPEELLTPGPGDLLWWQWLAFAVLLVIAFVFGRILGRLSRAVLGRFAARTEVTWDDELLARIRGPLALVWGIAIVYALSPWLGLYEPGREFLNRVLHVGLFLAFFWSLLRAVDITGQVVLHSDWLSAHPGARSLIPIARRVAKVLVFGLAVVSVLSQLGFPVASLIAGLGLGGLALALAAQKTVENLFGAFTISMDQPFREGDAIRMGEKVGTVESIGLRSTRVRTIERTLLAIPNSHLAEMQVESLAARDRMCLSTTIGLVYGTTEAQMRAVIAGFDAALRQHPKIWPEQVVVRFTEFADSSLNLEVLCWFRTEDFNEFRDIRQEVLLQFMAIVEQQGTSFAFPTRTVHMVGPTTAAPPSAMLGPPR